MNSAQNLLMRIGGTAQLVAGHMKQYWADQSTAKKTHKRPLICRGKYGRTLQSHFDLARSKR